MRGVQVHANYEADSAGRVKLSDAPFLMPMTAAEAAARRLPMPKNMVQAVGISPLLSCSAAGPGQQAQGRPAAVLRMLVTVPSRFCGVSVNKAGPRHLPMHPRDLPSSRDMCAMATRCSLPRGGSMQP